MSFQLNIGSVLLNMKNQTLCVKIQQLAANISKCFGESYLLIGQVEGTSEMQTMYALIAC